MNQIELVITCTVTSFGEIDVERTVEELEQILKDNGFKSIDVEVC